MSDAMKMVKHYPNMASYGGGGARQQPRFSGRMGMGGSPIPTSAAFGPPPGARRSNLQGSEAGPYGAGFSRGTGGSAGGAFRGSMAANNVPAHNSMGQTVGQSGGPNAVQAARQAGPDQAAIMAEMNRRKMGAQMGPQNAALSGYMMAKG